MHTRNWETAYDTSGHSGVEAALRLQDYRFPTVNAKLSPFFEKYINLPACLAHFSRRNNDSLAMTFNGSGQQGRKKAVFFGAYSVCLAFKTYLKVHIM